MLAKSRNHDSGDVEGDIAGESSRVRSLVATIAKGAGLAPKLLDGASGAALPLGLSALVPGGVVDSVSSSGIVGQ